MGDGQPMLGLKNSDMIYQFADTQQVDKVGYIVLDDCAFSLGSKAYWNVKQHRRVQFCYNFI